MSMELDLDHIYPPHRLTRHLMDAKVQRQQRRQWNICMYLTLYYSNGSGKPRQAYLHCWAASAFSSPVVHRRTQRVHIPMPNQVGNHCSHTGCMVITI